MHNMYMHDSSPPAWCSRPQAIGLDALSHQARSALNQLLMQCDAAQYVRVSGHMWNVRFARVPMFLDFNRSSLGLCQAGA